MAFIYVKNARPFSFKKLNLFRHTGCSSLLAGDVVTTARDCTACSGNNKDKSGCVRARVVRASDGTIATE